VRTLGGTLERVGVVDLEHHCAEEVHARAQPRTDYWHATGGVPIELQIRGLVPAPGHACIDER
jgi:hypothetical protein